MSRLGRGLSSLLNDNIVKNQSSELQYINLNNIVAGSYQPRKNFDDQGLFELTNSIKMNGVLQPIIVTRIDDDNYMIIAGERRFRAAKLACLNTIPAIVHSNGRENGLVIALIENIQRENLNPIEESEGYMRLVDEFSYTQEELAEIVGKSRSHIANMLRLKNLPDEVKQKVRNGEISAGHARAILMAKDPTRVMDFVINKGLNVRQTENIVRRENRNIVARGSSDLDFMDIEELRRLSNAISDKLDIKVDINHRNGCYEMIMTFADFEVLDHIMAKLDLKDD